MLLIFITSRYKGLMQPLNVAILGATGAVGEELLAVLAERKFPIKSLRLFSSHRSAGTLISWRDRSLRVEDIAKADLSGIEIAFFSAGGSTSKQYAGRFLQAGAVVIDNTSAFRMEPAVPLVVPEVNAHALSEHRGVIANPNCATIQLMAPLLALHQLAGLKRVVTSTYQSASGAGRRAMDELRDQAIKVLRFEDPPTKVFSRRLAFDIIPQIGDITLDGDTTEEEKMINESQKILELPELKVSATCVRVPTFIGHCISMNVELDKPCELAEVRRALEEAEGVLLCSDDEWPNASDVVGQDDVWVGRLRIDRSLPSGVNLWVAADNLRKGAACNAVQIAEELIARDLISVALPSL
jgi:aspartate-semialdehyde dehydrogenase